MSLSPVKEVEGRVGDWVRVEEESWFAMICCDTVTKEVIHNRLFYKEFVFHGKELDYKFSSRLVFEGHPLEQETWVRMRKK